MEGLSSDFAGMLPGRVITTDEICPIHHEPMLKLGWEKNSHPFCVACKREQIKQQETERLSNLQEQLFWRRTKKVLTKDSIFDDPDLQDATFANFEPNSDESKTNWNLARHLAGQYLDPKQTFNTIFTGVPDRKSVV